MTNTAGHMPGNHFNREQDCPGRLESLLEDWVIIANVKVDGGLREISGAGGGGGVRSC